MIVTAHQPNFLPGESILTKLEASDAVIWLDEVQFTKGGWINRNRIGGNWLTVPVVKHTDGAAINRVRISEHRDWRVRMVSHIQRGFPKAGVVCDEILRPYKLLVGMNVSILRHITRDALRGECQWHFQSHLDGGRAVQAVAFERETLLPISDRLAMMVGEVGGTVYLSGPSGRNYLDEGPFTERDIKVRYWSFTGGNTCALCRYA